MVFLPEYKDVKTMTTQEIVKEKNRISKTISLKEKDILSKTNQYLWIEDEAILYQWNVERLLALCAEIKSRIENGKWLWDSFGSRNIQ